MAASEYTNANRAFLQAIMGRGTITYEDSKPILAEIFSIENNTETEIRPEHVTEEDFLSYLDAASEAVSRFDYEIRSTVHQVTKKRIWALVNTTSDPQTQLATIYSPDELSFIKRILDAMFDKHNTPRMEVLAVSELQAVRLARPNRRESAPDTATQTQQATDKGLKHSEVEAVMTGLVEGGWFEKSPQDFYSLSPRALMELRPWLIETYNDPDLGPEAWQKIKFCEACKEIVTVGLRCSEQDCTFRLHSICEKAFWRTRRQKNCPKCSTAWTGQRLVGEKALSATEARQQARRRGGGATQATQRSTQRNRARVEADEEEEEE